MTHIIVPDETLQGFRTLFTGYPGAFGTGKGGWVHQEPGVAEFRSHLTGLGDGIGIGPLLMDGNCHFAAIDLDKPDFDLAKEMMQLLPGVSWLERSRSGNAHVHVFFESPVEAWVPRGIMRETLAAMGQKTVEVFPKTDRLRPGMVGNYLNLPYFGATRPIVSRCKDRHIDDWPITGDLENCKGAPLAEFVKHALADRNSPEDYRKRARWLGIPSPEERASGNTQTFGASPVLHRCAEYVIEHRDDNPVVEGHRAIVFFALGKMLANCSEYDDDEALSMMALVNDSSPDPISNQELERIYNNVKRGEFTSTSCDDPLFEPYRDPTCKIGR